MASTNPYQEFERLPVAKVLEQGLKDLVANGDLVETTARSYIVGFLSQKLVESGFLALEPIARGKK